MMASLKLLTISLGNLTITNVALAALAFVSYPCEPQYLSLAALGKTLYQAASSH